MEEEINDQLAFFETLLKRNIGEIDICISQLNNILPCSALLTIYRSFILLYDQPENEFVH